MLAIVVRPSSFYRRVAGRSNASRKGAGVVEWPVVKTQQAKQPIGVIQSLSSGFDLVTRHPELMLLPILLDAFLWLGPRLSAYPLFRALIGFMNSPDMMEALGPTSAQQMDPLFKLLDQTGQAFNLFWWLSPALLGVPALMVGVPVPKVPSGLPKVWAISSGLTYFALFLGLSVAGLALSAVYWGMLASRVREEPLGLRHIAGLWWGLFKIVILLTAVVLILGFPIALATTLTALVSPLVAQFVVLLGLSAMIWMLFYLAFTVHGVALRQVSVLQAVRASVLLMRLQFPSTAGLIFVALAVYIGLGFVWDIPPADSWLRAAGILGHAFVATGLFTATALYYMDRTRPVESRQPTVGL